MAIETEARDQVELTPETELTVGQIFYLTPESGQLSEKVHHGDGFLEIPLNTGCSFKIDRIDEANPDRISVTFTPKYNIIGYLLRSELKGRWLESTRNDEEMGLQRARSISRDEDIRFRQSDTQLAVRDLTNSAADRLKAGVEPKSRLLKVFIGDNVMFNDFVKWIYKNKPTQADLPIYSMEIAAEHLSRNLIAPNSHVVKAISLLESAVKEFGFEYLKLKGKDRNGQVLPEVKS